MNDVENLKNSVLESISKGNNSKSGIMDQERKNL